jgi:hypothetical protein
MPPAEALYRETVRRPDHRPTTGADRPAPTRRTVVIRGQVAPPPGGTGLRPGPARRRPPRRPSERIAGARPDRAALWAVMMGIFLIVVAVMTAHP